MPKCAAGLWVFCLVGCLVVISVATSSLNAQNVINVPADQATIQAAINVANNGDTVLVAPGKYVENINFNGKAITVTSSGGSSVTTIDGGANGSVVTFSTAETASSTLSGFTITNGSASNVPYSGGGIYISHASPTISGNLINGNVACATGGGIDVEFSSALIQGNTISNNSQKGCSGGGGGGISVGGAGAVQIVANTISNNSWNTAFGGGIFLNAAGTPTIENNTINGNTSYSEGGGIAIFNASDALIIQNLIFNNSSQQGGAIYFGVPSGSRGPFLINNTLTNNRGSGDAGIYATGFDAQSQFLNNILVSSSGQPALYCDTTYGQSPAVIQSNDAFVSGNAFGGGCAGAAGTNGNINADPLFFDSTNNFHIQFGSPAVDAGNNSAPNLPTTDFDGNPRVVDGNGDGIAVVDLGAYELSPTTITLAPTSLTFGAQAPGSTSAPQTVTLTNTGNQKLLLAISINPEFTQTNDCGSSVAAGASCSINVSFSPTVNGNISGNLTLKDTAANNPQTVALAGTGGAPVASLTPSSLSFGSQLVGTTSAAQTITLSNTGNDAMAIAGIASSGGEFVQTNNCGTTLAAGSSCSINVTFTPAATGSRPGLITVTDNAAGSPQSVPLTGTGTAPAATLSPASLSFGGQLIGTTSTAQSATLSNTGSAPLSISAISASGDFAQTNNCGSTLAAGSTCSINVTFTPTALGTRSGSVTVTDNASGSPHSISLTGTGTAAIASLSPSSLAFGAQVIGTTSPAQSATLSNTGNAPLAISAITINGDFAETTTCGSTLAAGASCAINVTFTPSATGARGGSLSVSSNSQNGAVAAALSGSGAENAPSFSPASLTFASRIVGTESGGKNVQLTANGPGPLVISSITVTGQFLESNNCPASLNSGSNCNITINFLPTVAGPASGAIVVADNGLGSTQTIPLSGTGLDFTLSASPASVTANAGYSAQYTVTATEVGGSFNNSVNLSCSGLPAGAKCQFSPGGITPHTGSASSNLTIQTTARQGSHGTPAGSYTITINGVSGSLKHTTTVNLTVN